MNLFCCRTRPIAPVARGRAESGDGLGLIGSVGHIEHYWPVKSQAIASEHTEKAAPTMELSNYLIGSFTKTHFSS